MSDPPRKKGKIVIPPRSYPILKVIFEGTPYQQDITEDAYEKATRGDYSGVVGIVAAYTEEFGNPNPVRLTGKWPGQTFVVPTYFSNWEWSVYDAHTGADFGNITLGMGLRLYEQDEEAIEYIRGMIEAARENTEPRELLLQRQVGWNRDENEAMIEWFTITWGGGDNIFASAGAAFWEAVDALTARLREPPGAA